MRLTERARAIMTSNEPIRRDVLQVESGDINHTMFNKTDAPMVHVLFEILVNLNGPSLIPVRYH
jgi:hypothetical protein